MRIAALVVMSLAASSAAFAAEGSSLSLRAHAGTDYSLNAEWNGGATLGTSGAFELPLGNSTRLGLWAGIGLAGPMCVDFANGTGGCTDGLYFGGGPLLVQTLLTAGPFRLDASLVGTVMRVPYIVSSLGLAGAAGLSARYLVGPIELSLRPAWHVTGVFVPSNPSTLLQAGSATLDVEFGPKAVRFFVEATGNAAPRTEQYMNGTSATAWRTNLDFGLGTRLVF